MQSSQCVDSVTVARSEPVPHRYAPSGLGVVRCGICERPGDDPCHTKGLVDQIGADATQCLGCDEIWPIEMTVRMLRFAPPDGRVFAGHDLRVCQKCAGMRVDDWSVLALRREKGWISEDLYIERLQSLVARTNLQVLVARTNNQHG